MYGIVFDCHCDTTRSPQSDCHRRARSGTALASCGELQLLFLALTLLPVLQSRDDPVTAEVDWRWFHLRR